MPNRLRAHAVCAIDAVLAVGCALDRMPSRRGGTFEFVSPVGRLAYPTIVGDPGRRRRP